MLSAANSTWDSMTRTVFLVTSLSERAFQVHPCRYPVIGIRDVFDQLTHADVLRYYRRRYLPNNLFLVVAGDVDTDRVRSDAEELLGFAKRGPLEPVVLPEEPPQLGRRETSQYFQADLAYFNLGWHVPGVSHDDMAPVDAASVILGGGASSRLYQGAARKGRLGLRCRGVRLYAELSRFAHGLRNLRRKRSQAWFRIALWSASTIDVNAGCLDAELRKAKRMITVNAIEQLQTVKGVASDLGLELVVCAESRFQSAIFGTPAVGHRGGCGTELLLAISRIQISPSRCSAPRSEPETGFDFDKQDRRSATSRSEQRSQSGSGSGSTSSDDLLFRGVSGAVL